MMAKALQGVDETLRNLNREISGVEGRTQAGLWAGGLIVQRTSQKRVPVEFGVLRASAYTRKSSQEAAGSRGVAGAITGGTGIQAIEVGYNASYAVYVHENMEQKLKGEPRPSGLGVYWGPAGQPKFLESALIDEADNVLKQVAGRARIRGAA